MMLTKEECEKALENLRVLERKDNFTKWGGQVAQQINCDVIEQLIKERFEPQPYKFEELKKGMWVWDNKLKMCVEITDIIELEGENKKCVDYGFGYVEYKENHLFPVTKAMEYQGKEMKDDGKEK